MLECVTEGMRALLNVREELVLPWPNDQLEEDAELIHTRSPLRLLQEMGWKSLMSSLVRLWHDEGIQQAFRQTSNVAGVSYVCSSDETYPDLSVCDILFDDRVL